MKAIIFARVSSKDQEDGQSIPAQVRRLTEYALKRNFTIDSTYQVTESSSKETRKQFEQIINYVKKAKEPFALITDTVDRLQRSFRETPMLDELRASDKVSVLAKAYIHSRLLEIEAIRPQDWGARIAPAIESDRAALKELGSAELRSGDWMLPTRIQRFEGKLTEFYKRTRDVSYLKQARFFERLFADAHLAGMKFAGYVTADGKPSLTIDGARSKRLWGLSEDGLRLALLWPGRAGETVSLAKPQPLSPLFFCGREPSELLKATSEQVQLDWQAAAIRDYLPPLFEGEIKP